MKRQIITVAAIKGGTGKTSTAGALTQAAAVDGRRVLAIDLDPQSSLSIWLRADLSRADSYDLITGRADPVQTIQRTESGVDVICGSADLTALKTGPSSAHRLERALRPVLQNYDLIAIDTAPAMGEAQNNALYASTGLLIPLETDSASLQGLYQILDVTKHIQEGCPSLHVLGTVITKYDSRPKINRFMRDTIKETGEALGAPLLAEIRQGVALREAMALQCSLYQYAPRSNPAQDYMTLYQLLVQ